MRHCLAERKKMSENFIAECATACRLSAVRVFSSAESEGFALFLPLPSRSNSAVVEILKKKSCKCKVPGYLIESSCRRSVPILYYCNVVSEFR